MNTPPTLEPIPYSLDSGRLLSDFLDEFETFALKTYGADQRLWIARLKKYLEPPILDLYNDLVKVHQDYFILRTALIDSYDASAIPSHEELVDRFENFKYSSQEGIRGLVSRLNALATEIYSGASPRTITQVVKRRCVNALPSHIKETLNFWLLSNPNASLQEFMRVGSGLEKSVAVPEAAAASASTLSNTIKPQTPVVKQRYPNNSNNVNPSNNVNSSSVSSSTNSGSRPRICTYCNKRGHIFDNCHQRTSTCYKCSEIGHYASNCPDARSSSGRSGNPPDVQNPPPLLPPSAPPTPQCMFCCQVGHLPLDCPGLEALMDRIVRRNLNH